MESKSRDEFVLRGRIINPASVISASATCQSVTFAWREFAGGGGNVSGHLKD
jgi:hypothetical protein